MISTVVIITAVWLQEHQTRDWHGISERWFYFVLINPLCYFPGSNLHWVISVKANGHLGLAGGETGETANKLC